LASDEIGDGQRSRHELRQVDPQPFGKRRVDIEDLALAPCGKEAGRSVVEVVDRVLQLPEEPFLVIPFGSDVGDLPDVEALRLSFAVAEYPGLEAIPMGARPVAAGRAA